MLNKIARIRQFFSYIWDLDYNLWCVHACVWWGRETERDIKLEGDYKRRERDISNQWVKRCIQLCVWPRTTENEVQPEIINRLKMF